MSEKRIHSAPKMGFEITSFFSRSMRITSEEVIITSKKNAAAQEDRFGGLGRDTGPCGYSLIPLEVSFFTETIK